MADDLTFPLPGGTKVAADDLGGGIKAQRVKVGFGPDGSLVDVDTGTPLPVTVIAFNLSTPLPVAQQGAATVAGGVRADSGPSPASQVVYVQPVDESGNVITGGGGGGGGSTPTMLTADVANVIDTGDAGALVSAPGAGHTIVITGYSFYADYVGSSNKSAEVWVATFHESGTGGADLGRCLFAGAGDQVQYAGGVDAPAVQGGNNRGINLVMNRAAGDATSLGIYGHIAYYVT